MWLRYYEGSNIGCYYETRFYGKDESNFGGMFVFLSYAGSDGKYFLTDWQNFSKFFAFFELLA